MDVLVLFLVLATSVGVAAALVAAFGRSIEAACEKIVPGEVGAAWAKYGKFALFITTLAGGLRLMELQAYVQPNSPGITYGQVLFEVFKSGIGALVGGAWTLLVVLSVVLIAYLVREGYQRMGDENGRAPAARAPFTAARH
jgi:hypothetical protein